MDLLVLGGTVFLSRAVAVEGVRRGHRVTCASRQLSGAVPDGVRAVPLDRERPDFTALAGPWDAVVDVARDPRWVDDALSALVDRTAHWTFVSTISVYADHSARGGTPATLPLLDPLGPGEPEGDADSPDGYGARKVWCEQAVRARAPAAFVVRPGLIVGPGDPMGRFSYWPWRLAQEGEVLAPVSPRLDAQVVDVRDLAAWIVTAAERRLTGTFDGVGERGTLGGLLAEVARGVGRSSPEVPEPTWADADFLADQHVSPWAGPRSLPVWAPAGYQGILAHDAGPAQAAGLVLRPLARTARDTLIWLREHPGDPVGGLTRAEEHEVLTAWHTIRG